MPTIAHAILGGTLAIIFYTMSQRWNPEKKFTERMVILFSFNSMIGPDIFTMMYAFHMGNIAEQIPIRPFVHSILGWPVWCLGIMWIWYFVINLRSTDDTKLSKLSALLLLIAAGEMHFYLDMLDDGVHLIAFGNWGVYLSWQDNFLTGMKYQYGPLSDTFPWFSMTEMFFIGLVFMILLIYTLFKKELIWTYIVAGIFFASIIGLYFLFGSYIFGFENDFGVILYFGTLFIVPLMLMGLAME